MHFGRLPLTAVITGFIVETVETIVIALSIFVVVYLFAFQPHEVQGQSMDGIDGFHNGQYILTDKITFRFREPRRGDVIVFKYPLNKQYDYIKRVIAVPGEEIELRDNRIVIYNKNIPEGFTLDESKYLGSDVVTEPKAFLKDGLKLTVPDDKFIAMGDNRTQSSDSRSWGFVPRDDIIGRSFFRYWPPNEIGLIKHHNLDEQQ